MNVEISTGHRVDFFNFALNGFAVSEGEVETESKIVFQPDGSTLDPEWDLEVVPG